MTKQAVPVFRAAALLSMVSAVAVATAVSVSTAVAARPLPGVPANASLLFVLDSAGGTLTAERPDRRGSRPGRRYVLTLTGLDRKVTWFTDRPRREAGSISAGRLFARWGAFGFRKVPPNAALVVEEAHRKRDTMAIELRLRSFEPRRDRVTFAVKTLGGLGKGLRRLANRVDRRVAARFGRATLFVDNASTDGYGCMMGQPQLFATTAPIKHMLPADGRKTSVAQNAALFSIYGTAFGGDGKSTFGLPKLTAPPGMAWQICVNGQYPSAGLPSNCALGEVDYWALPALEWVVDGSKAWAPADGRTVTASRYPQYAATFTPSRQTFALPNVPAPPGMMSLVCMFDDPTLPATSQLDMFLAPPSGRDWLPADGRQLSITGNQMLFSLMGTAFGPATFTSFTFPNLPAPVAGLTYYGAVQGIWPVD